jgi:hypothetical protein
MFNAELISLANGQSYENVQVCEPPDLIKHNIPLLFEHWTGCIFVGGKCLVVHHWKIKVIHLSRSRRGGSHHVDRLVIDGDITYAPASMIDSSKWARLGIPEFFIKRGGIAGQMAWTCPQGTFITHDTNIVSIVMPDRRKSGITSAIQPKISLVIPKQTAVGKIGKGSSK